MPVVWLRRNRVSCLDENGHADYVVISPSKKTWHHLPTLSLEPNSIDEEYPKDYLFNENGFRGQAQGR